MATILLVFSGCQKVINIDLEEGQKHIVVDASIDWKVGSLGKDQSITISQTYPYFSSSSMPTVSGAIVNVFDSEGNKYSFKEDNAHKGRYITNSFVPNIGEKYTLHILFNGNNYYSYSVMQQAPLSVRIDQENDVGVSSKSIALRGYIKGIPDIRQSYLVSISTPNMALPKYITLLSSDFRPGYSGFYFSSKDIKKGDIVTIRVYGITKDYVTYFEQLLSLSNAKEGGKPFTAPPSIVRGNIVNKTNSEDDPLGYFRTSQYLELPYTIK